MPRRRRSLSKNPGVDKGPQSLMFNPALTTCASERMKTQRFSYFAGFAARERMREAKPVKTRKSGVQPLFRQSQSSISILRFAKNRIAPCGRQLLILLAELFLIQHWIADKPAALKVFPVHIYSGYLMVCVGGIVIDTSGGITA